MKTIYSFVLVLCAIGSTISQAPTLTLLNSYSLTPNTTDTIGAFARIYYHQPRNKFYVTYAARQAGSAQPAGMLSNFAWREYDANMNFTGNKGSLPGFTGAGDYAMVQVDSTYYHLTNYGSTSTGTLQYKLTKMDDDFNSIATKTFVLSSHDSNIDQLMNYTNGKLIIGAMYESSASPPVTPPAPTYSPNIHLYQYDLNLNSLASPILFTQQAYSWGASCIFNAGNYYFISTDNIATHKLYCWKYDANFNYISRTQINNDGQWSQGVLFIGGYYFVSHHVGDHNHGNVTIDILDANWNAISTTTVTNFTIPTVTGQVSYNCNRPFMTLVGNKLYISYDIEKYTFPVNEKTWQAGVKVYQINGITGIAESENHSNVILYPNPAANELTFRSDADTELNIYDVFGNIALKKQCEENTVSTLDISFLSPGMYVCQFKFQGKTVNKKIIKN